MDNKQQISKQLLGITDLAERWHYKTVHGVRKRRKYDRKFPEPISIINNRVLVFWLPDIEAYEKMRGLDEIQSNRYTFYETKEEWQSKSREERETQRGYQYTDEEWEKEQNHPKSHVTDR